MGASAHGAGPTSYAEVFDLFVLKSTISACLAAGEEGRNLHYHSANPCGLVFQHVVVHIPATTQRFVDWFCLFFRGIQTEFESFVRSQSAPPFLWHPHDLSNTRLFFFLHRPAVPAAFLRSSIMQLLTYSATVPMQRSSARFSISARSACVI